MSKSMRLKGIAAGKNAVIGAKYEDSPSVPLRKDGLPPPAWQKGVVLGSIYQKNKHKRANAEFKPRHERKYIKKKIRWRIDLDWTGGTGIKKKAGSRPEHVSFGLQGINRIAQSLVGPLKSAISKVRRGT